ncbi:TonB-dependent siderophore receptor [Moritella viscosa]|uniref:Ferrichrome-iron receptor n=1 Tax=Moritella viscosa TaxID=80854 RepID=A0A1L0AEX5_9GAMM|nr:TonB-dependent siderophore receptor [Moritella viscosa]SGZ11122.1 Ferrichrome-iron receptor [Moritella viscosa]SHO12134.1 Ferrichrome-iron receptor [Moritella viscosa]SHO12136.1 Ferrichrome-iron receptor [Moritella viscosa]SHO16459.1 Ferrichrome-iron receptor [Moritella viscosa]SHO18304.1 Ferrichrome-iron receptor [Moritella viscosa]
MKHQPARILSPVAFAIICALSSSAFAEQSSRDNTEEQMTVFGKAYRNTATKTALAPIDTPQAITDVDRETLDLRGVKSVAEALRYVPAVNTELRGGAVSRLDLFNIRGFINYQNFYDGLPLMFNGWNLQPQIDSIALEQVEVFKGPTSVLYGNIPPGGMVNLIAKSPQQEQSTDVTVAGGDFNRKELSIDSTGQIADTNLSYRVVGMVRKKDGQADTSEEERYVLAPSLDWQVSDKTLVNFNVYYQNDPSAGIYTSVPGAGSVLSNPNGQLDSSTFTGDENWNTYEREVLMLGYKINHEFNNSWAFLMNARYMDADAYQENTYNGALQSDMRTVGRNAYLTDEKSQSFVIDNQISGRFNTGVLEHNVLLGFDYQQLDSRIIYKDASAPSIDVFNPNHQQIDGSSLNFTYTTDFDLESNQVGLYLQDQLVLGNLVVIAGGRYDEYEQTSTDHASGVDTAAAIKQDNFAFRLGGLYSFDNGLAPYVSYAQSFEPVVGKDRHGNVFVPSTGEQWEAGLKYESADMSKKFVVSLFNITKQNDLTRDPTGTAYDKVQTGETQSRGVEVEANTMLTDNMDLAVSYTYMDMKVTEDNTGLEGKTPIWVPKHAANVWLNYYLYNGMAAGTTIGTGIRYVGETQIDALNRDQVPDYTLVDLSVSYDLSYLSDSLDGSSISVVASNLFGTDYYSCYDTDNCWFGAERDITANVKFNF